MKEPVSRKPGLPSESLPLIISNDEARRLWLDVNGLGSSRSDIENAPVSSAPMEVAARIVSDLGLVQLDPLRPVARAHEHILWTRGNQLRPRHFERLLEERKVFEHFSHDACILPMEAWPYWRRQFKRRAKAMERGSWGCAMPPPDVRKEILTRIEREGALCSRDFGKSSDQTVGAWTKPPHKVALDWLWISGRLAVTHRRGFIKHYDLTERVVPKDVSDTHHDDALQRNWLCRRALERLGTATPGQLQRFWDALTAAEVRAWIDGQPRAWQAVVVVGEDGTRTPCLAPSNIEQRLQALGPVSKRLRIINPFDPAVRDRKRLASLFGFDFRIEIYVPPEKRRFGYYVCPLLEGTQFIGRIEVRSERQHDRLDIVGLWLEPGVRFGRGRQDRLRAELARFARLGGVSSVGVVPEP